MTLAWRTQLTAEDYARYHPGGALGRSVSKVSEVMRRGPANPVVRETAQLSHVLAVMTKTPGRPGAALVVDAEGRLIGIFTDGDLRRLAEQQRLDVKTRVREVMARRPRWVSPDELVLAATALMREAKVDQLPVLDPEGRPVGLLDVQDLLASRLL